MVQLDMDDATNLDLLPKIPTKKRIDKSYSWRRLFARLIDYQISALILSGLILYTPLVPDAIVDVLADSQKTVVVWGLISTAQWMILESLLLTMFKTTPGKVLSGLRLTSEASNPNYWLRSLAVWAVGVGFGLPLITMFAGLIALDRMKSHGIADWDRWTNFKVEPEPLGYSRVMVVAVLITLILGNQLLITVSSSHPKLTATKIQNETDKAYDDEVRLNQAQEVLAKNAAEEKFEALTKKAEAGDADAQNNLGVMYANGQGVPQDSSKAFEWYQKSAEQGNAVAQDNLGAMYTDGVGVPKDLVKAFEWYQKAAEQGNAIAQSNLGFLYHYGKGVPKDLVKAFEWYQKAVAQGNAIAQFNLGLMYYNGEDVPKDFVKAFEWFQKAAELGAAEAQVDLGWMYANGQGIPKDFAKAFEWYQKSSEQGYALAQFKLGMAYVNGQGVPKDLVKAFEWFEKAAEQGDAGAQYNLGAMYYNGQGVTKNKVLAYVWTNLAAAQGEVHAQEIRDMIEKELTDAERTDGQRLASNWKKGDILIESVGGSSSKAIPSDKPSKQLTGTAFVVSYDGHALTNHHVINGCTEIKIAGREGIATVITSDNVNDLALLQLPGNIKDIARLNPEPGKLRQGEDIIVFGYPLNSVLSSGGNLTPGTVSALTGLGNNTNQIQITAPIQPGSSGSPVMDKKVMWLQWSQ